jgi:tungstate transport system substrate-binding protein
MEAARTGGEVLASAETTRLQSVRDRWLRRIELDGRPRAHAAGAALFGPCGTIRLAVVNTPDVLLSAVLPQFEEESGCAVTVTSTEAVFSLARDGQVDMVIAHYGHSGTEAFVTEGLGLWPHAVFANKAAIWGPSADPAGIRDLANAVEAFRRIAETRTPFVVNNATTEKYLADILWEAAGRPDRIGWYVDKGLRDREAVDYALTIGGYVVWGLVPGLRYKLENPNRDIDALSSSDALFDRGMVAIKVNPSAFEGINANGAAALERYLIRSDTQARIRDFRGLGYPGQMWVPTGRNNSSDFLRSLP